MLIRSGQDGVSGPIGGPVFVFSVHETIIVFMHPAIAADDHEAHLGP